MQTSQLKRLLNRLIVGGSIALGLLLFNPIADAAQFWRCVAWNARGEHWHYYDWSRKAAKQGALQRCERRSRGRFIDCNVRCDPPRSRWRCAFMDIKGLRWVWVASSRREAFQDARRACLLNSRRGGCRPVPNEPCAPLRRRNEL